MATLLNSQNNTTIKYKPNNYLPNQTTSKTATNNSTSNNNKPTWERNHHKTTDQARQSNLNTPKKTQQHQTISKQLHKHHGIKTNHTTEPARSAPTKITTQNNQYTQANYKLIQYNNKIHNINQ